jgi:hypothetical protein
MTRLSRQRAAPVRSPDELRHVPPEPPPRALKIARTFFFNQQGFNT